MGYTEDQALNLIMSCCASAQVRAEPLGGLDLTWLAEVYEEARQCLYRRRYPQG